jgi:hypothetical protein
VLHIGHLFSCFRPPLKKININEFGKRKIPMKHAPLVLGIFVFLFCFTACTAEPSETAEAEGQDLGQKNPVRMDP